MFAAWRAPETFVSVGGQQEVSAKTDVYMFGCFMLEMLTGQEPLWWIGAQGGRMEEVIFLRRSRPEVCPLEFAEEAGVLDVSGVVDEPGVWGTVADIVALIRGCMAYSRANRPDMATVMVALESFRDNPEAGRKRLSRCDSVLLHILFPHAYAGAANPEV